MGTKYSLSEYQLPRVVWIHRLSLKKINKCLSENSFQMGQTAETLQFQKVKLWTQIKQPKVSNNVEI